MDRPEEARGSDDREARAGRALHAYHERRRRRRADDTWLGSDAGLLPPPGEEAGEEERAVRRRIELLEEAEDEGMPGELASMTYDVAREEGVDPALAYELVRSGLGVAPPPEGVDNAPAQPTTDKYTPLWLSAAIPTDHLLRERMLRLSLRRLRQKLEEHGDPDGALRAFAREPDVEVLGY